METILHICDLHFGIEGANDISLQKKSYRKNCLDSLLHTIKSLEPAWKPTILCLTGDLVWSGAATEYAEAKRWLDKLIDACGLSYDDLVICAGNHEVDRRLLDRQLCPNNASEADYLLGYPIGDSLEKPFAEFQRFCASAAIPVLQFGKETSYLVGARKIRDLRFIALNTAWFSRGVGDEGQLWFGLPHLRHMESNDQAPLLRDAGCCPITIALMHHPDDWLHYHERHEDEENKRPSALDYLACRCHILLTGHTHGRARNPNRIYEGAYHFNGGATYAESNYSNCFRLLQIDQESITHRSVTFDPVSPDLNWVISTEKSIAITKTNRKVEATLSIATDKQATRNAYLQWLIACHEQIELRGVQYPQGGTVSVPLQQVYLALQADASTALERAAAKQILLEEVRAALDSGEIPHSDAEQAIWLVMAGSPNMPALEARDRLNAHDPTRKQLLNLAQAYFEESYLVILGDPGSGKTTLARWLALVSAKAAASEYLNVPMSQVDPDEVDETKQTSLGLTRLPVLVRIADYADARSKAPTEGCAMPTLTEFLCRQKWQGQIPVWPPEHPQAATRIAGDLIHELIQEALAAGKALIILDGLDEISDSTLRGAIVEEVDRFAQQWVHPWLRGRKIDVIQPVDLAATLLFIPSFTANQLGNRLVITSRIAGYHQAALRGNMAHVTVEPMNITAVKKFITQWMKAVHRALSGTDPSATAAAQHETQQLLNKLEDPRYFGARELVTNPLLCSLLATMFRYGKGDLPQRRVELYQQAIDKLIDIWLRREPDKKTAALRKEEMFAILEPIAEYIHSHEPTGLLTDKQLSSLALRYLAEFHGENPEKPSLTTRTTVQDLMHIVSEDVGLIAARGEKMYGFLHLTFQEYLAARSLLREPTQAAARIAERLSDARWREVIRLALGETSRRDPQQLLCLTNELLDQHSDLQDLLPQAALTIIAALADIETVPDELIENLVERLLRAYSQRALLEQLPSRRELLQSALRHLISSRFEQQVAACFRQALKHAEKQPDQAAAAAELTRRLDFYPVKLAAALQNALHHDVETWYWPVHAALRIGITPRDGEFTPRLLPAPGSLVLRQALLDDKQLLERLRADPEWLGVIIALYGGFGDYEVSDSIGNYRTLAHFLQMEDNARNRHGFALKERWGGEDFVYNIAVHLDTVGATQKKSWDKPPKFSAELIFRDRDNQLTTAILKALRGNEPPSSLLPILQKAVEGNTDAKLAAWLLNSSAVRPTDTLLTEQIACLQASLVDACVRCGPLLPAAFTATLEFMLATQRWALFEAAANLVLLHGGQPFGLDLWKLAPQLQPSLRPYLLAELLMHYARGYGDDAVYDTAQFADTVACSPQELIEAFCLGPIAALRHCDLNLYDWPLVLLPPISCRNNDIPTAVLTSIELLPAALGFLRAWSLGQRLLPLVEANPALLPDVIAACLGDVGERNERKYLLEIYQPELLQSPSPAIDTLVLARAVKNPYYRARALCRLIRHLPSQKPCLLDEAAAAAETISDPFELSQVLELLTANQSGKARMLYWQGCRDATLRITDAEQRARAWARLGLLALPTDAHACFQQALSAATQISDELARGSTLRILAPLLRNFADLHQAMIATTARFNDPLLAARAHENWYEVLRSAQTSCSRSASEHDLWVVLTLMARTSSNSATPQQAMDALWYQLAANPCAETLEKLLNVANTERLDCTLAAIQCLDGLLETVHAELAEKLMPQLRAKAAEAIPFLERATHLINSAVAASAALLLAEMRGLSEGVVPGLIEALQSTDDLTRLRACELLYSGSNEKPSHRASVIGKTGLDALFRARNEASDSGAIYIGNAIVWFSQRLVYDLAEQIKDWAEQLNHDEHAVTAKYALSHISHIEAQAFQQIFLELAGGNANVKRAILISMAHLARLERLDAEAWNALNTTMEKLDLTALESPKYLVFELTELCELALEALPTASDTQIQIQTARKLLTDRYGISFADIFRLPIEERLAQLKSFGDMMYTKTAETARWSNSAAAARNGVAHAGFIDLLCAWLIQALGENLNDPYAPHFERTCLLDLLLGAAMAAPASFARCKALPELEPWLIAVVQKNYTYTARADALLLLGYYRRLSAEALPALRCGLADVEPVRDAAMEAALLFRSMDDEVLQELTQCLYAESSLLALAAARLLTTLGRHDKASTSKRQRIVEALASAVRDPRSYRPVHFDAGLTPAPEVAKLNDFFYDALLKVAGYEVDRRTRTQ